MSQENRKWNIFAKSNFPPNFPEYFPPSKWRQDVAGLHRIVFLVFEQQDRIKPELFRKIPANQVSTL